MSRDRRLARTSTVFAAAWLAVAPLAFAQEPDAAGPPPSVPVLFLTDGGHLSGALADSEGPVAVRWSAAPFVAPFDFFTGRVAAIRWPAPKDPPTPAGDLLFETTGGDILFGSLVDLTEKAVVLDVPPHGRLTLDRSRLRRFAPARAEGELVYVGPNGLAGWKPSGPASGWREEGADLLSVVAGSAIRADLGVPSRAAIELEVSWSNPPSFVIAFGVGETEASVHRAFRIEVWDDDLVAVAETNNDADVASIQKVEGKAGRAHILAFLDREIGRFVVVTSEGRKLADVQVEGRPGKSPGGVSLANAGGDVRVERLRISRWDGALPAEADAAKSHVQRADGSIVHGDSVTFDPAAKALVVAVGKESTRVRLDQTAAVRLAAPDDARADDSPRTVRAVARDGSRLSGMIVKITTGAVWLRVPGFADPLKLPVDSLRSLHGLGPGDAPPIPLSAENPGVLEMEGLRLHGRLVAGQKKPDASCLVWQPFASANASPLRPGVSGRIVYHEAKPVETPMGLGSSRARPMPMNAMRRVVINGKVVMKPYQASVAVEAGRRIIHLRTGDTIVADVSKIDEQGVWFDSPSSDNKFIPHEKIKAVELGRDVRRTVVLNRTKFDRLLTLPRLQKGSPPTHLLRSTNGDYLRGRVVGMDDKNLQIEVRLDNRAVPRDRIARITWLHPDELDPAKPPASPTVPPGATRVQSVRNDGIRLTFLADRFEGATLSGKSDVIGICRSKIGGVDQVLFGSAIESAAAKLAVHQWKLHNAPDPKFARESGEGADPSAGAESELVGKPAPDFTLDLLGDGKKTFRLADAKGSVVILDFWATWCGPCLQAMPQVERVADEFKERGVTLIAVNLQENPDQINALLERRKLHPTVALDRDGAVAAQYKAVAIPQTVVIDREGKVARLFVGSSPDLADKLRAALKAVLPDGSKPVDVKK